MKVWGIKILHPNQLRAKARGSFFLLILPFALSLSCSRSSLQALEKGIVVPPPTPEGVHVNFCTDQAQAVNTRLKYLIILDHSGSNQQNYLLNPDGSGGPLLTNGVPTISTQYATDPLGKTRYGNNVTPGTLLNFLNTAPANDPANPLRWYALINFSSQATPFPRDETFTSDTTRFYQHVQMDSGGGSGIPTDGGSTNYVGTLDLAYKIINGDIQHSKDCAQRPLGSASTDIWCPTPGKQFSSTYVIVFMSDGAPITDSGLVIRDGAVVSTGPPVKQPASQILGQVQALVDLQIGNAVFVDSVNLFTVYYYAPGNIDLSGKNLLEKMAQKGNGVAYSAISNTNIDYTRFTPPGKLIKNSLSDIFVSNSSVNWWTDGKLRLDSDMDGIPDEVEIALGSDLFNPDSDGNGVADFVEYQLLQGKPCKALDLKGLCVSVGSVDYASTTCKGILTQLAPSFPNARPIKGSAIRFTSSDPNGLNDCEKKLLNDIAGINNPDSNGDLIPDWLEFKNGVPFQIGNNVASDSQNLDGYSFYQKIKLSLPANIPFTQLLNPQVVVYNLSQISTSPLQDCYNLIVDHLPLIENGNTVRVDILMKSPLVQNSLIYRTGKKSFSGTSKVLQFEDWNDPSEKKQGTWSSWP